eukprot:scaffold128_cov248-Pinguiococcus_pyrenoidosus.AAC.30
MASPAFPRCWSWRKALMSPRSGLVVSRRPEPLAARTPFSRRCHFRRFVSESSTASGLRN